MIPRPNKPGNKGAGPFSTTEVENPPQTPLPKTSLLETPALEDDTSRGNDVVDLESDQFKAALDREVARILDLRDERPIKQVPLGNFEIARRVDRPLGDQPSSKRRERKANPINYLRPTHLQHIDEYDSLSEESESYGKNFTTSSTGGNPRKNFSSGSENNEIKRPNNNNKKKGANIRTTRDSSLNGDSDSSSSDEISIVNIPKNKVNESNNKMVKRTHYQTNTTVLISEIDKLVIDVNTPDKFSRLRLLHNLLETTGLLSLIEGHRTEPIIGNPANVHGYTERSIILVTRIQYEDEESMQSSTYEPTLERVVLEEDDAFHYIHDNKRLYQIVQHMFAKSVCVNIKLKTQKLRSGIDAYKEMVAYVFGQKQQDVKFARKALDNFNINPSILFRTAYIQWEQLFNNLEHAQSRQMDDVEKMAWVSDRLDADPRPKIASSFASCVVSNMTYEEAMAVMLRVADTMPPETATWRLASMSVPSATSSSNEYQLYQNTMMNQSQQQHQLNQYQHLANPNQNPIQQRYSHDINSKSNQIQDARSLPDNNNNNNTKKKPVKNGGFCFAFAKGNCNRGDNCQYIHDETKKKENLTPSASGPPPGTQFKKGVQFDLTQAQIDSVGAKAGGPNSKTGYSKNQIRKLNSMRYENENTEVQVRAFSSWGNPSAPPYQTNEERVNTLMRIRIEENDQRILKSDRQNQRFKSVEYDGKLDSNEIKTHHRCLLQNVTNNYEACSIPQRAINASILLAEQYYHFHQNVIKYHRNDLKFSIVPYVFLFKTKKTIKDNQERNNQYTDLFGWHKNDSVKTNKRKDIRTPTVKWMHLMYQICATLLQAIVVLPPADEKATMKHFNTFNPYMVDGVIEQYITSLQPGAFWSQSTNVAEYAEVIRRLELCAHFNKVLNNTLFIDTVIHAVILDFIAFAGQHMGYFHSNSNLDLEDMLRKVLIMDIQKQNDPSFVMFGIRDAFLVIARLVRPVIDTVKRTLCSPLTQIVYESVIKIQKTRTPNPPFATGRYTRSRSPTIENHHTRRQTQQLSPIVAADIDDYGSDGSSVTEYDENGKQTNKLDQIQKISGEQLFEPITQYEEYSGDESPLSQDEQYEIKTPVYIEYIGGTRIVDYENLKRFRHLKGYDVHQKEPDNPYGKNFDPTNKFGSDDESENEQSVMGKSITLDQQFMDDVSDEDDNKGEMPEERHLRLKKKLEETINDRERKKLKISENENENEIENVKENELINISTQNIQVAMTPQMQIDNNIIIDSPIKIQSENENNNIEDENRNRKEDESEDDNNTQTQSDIDNEIEMKEMEKAFKSLRTFNSVKSNKMTGQIIFDSGASTCATSDPSLLRHIIYGQGVKATPAFGPSITSQATGLYGPLSLEIILMEGMQETLVSISQLCKGGLSGVQNAVIFTSEGMRCFTFESIRDALALIDKLGVEVIRGYISNGIYVYKPNETDKNINEHHNINVNNNNTLSPNVSSDKDALDLQKSVNNAVQVYLTQFKPNSLWDHLHLVTGHPGVEGMKWHFHNSTGAKYTVEDEHRQRGTCRGCVYGAMHQTATDHRREHRDLPTKPGQCFTVDAYTHTYKSIQGFGTADIYTDLATRRCYPVYTKDRSAHELCVQSDKLFTAHPDWKYVHDEDTRRFIRLDPERNYRSYEFLAFASSKGYSLERTPARDKHAGGVAERQVGHIVAKTNVAMLSPDNPVPQSYWNLAMSYACDTASYNYNSVIGTSPYMKITGQPVNIKYLQPFWSSCYVFIPLSERTKLGAKRAYKAKFAGYANTFLLFPHYYVIPFKNGQYGKMRESKDVIFDPTIDFKVYTEDEEPYDREFVHTDHYVPFLHRQAAPVELQGQLAQPYVEVSEDTFEPDFPERSQIFAPPAERNEPIPFEDTNDDNINIVNMPYTDENDEPVYWYSFYVRNENYARTMCETQHFSKLSTPTDPRIPKCFRQAVRIPEWKNAIDKECEKFDKNDCFTVVPFNGQQLVSMMWLFNIKTDGTYKARLVARGDLMKPFVHYHPNDVYCGNVSATSIKIAIAIAAAYKLTMRGGDLEGAYLVTRANAAYPIFIKTPEGYNIPEGMCIQSLGNIYGNPVSGQNFSLQFDKCVKECDYINTPWDPKLFYKWKEERIILLMAHSDDFRWFGDNKDLNEWDILIKNFNKHKYKVTDCTDKEFVGIRITCDTEFNYYMDQTRMIEEIIDGIGMKNAKDEALPYPLDKLSLSKLDNATPAQLSECSKFPYRRIVGQLMYGLVHTMVAIMYALNVLSRYGNNPGPRHIDFAKHLLRYVKMSKADRLKFQTHNGPKDIKTMTKFLQLRFQCDADLAGNPDTLHSQTSYLGYLGPSLICWCSTDQGSISTSTAESEIKAVNHTLKAEVISTRGILNQMGWKQDPTVIEEDNKACVDASIITHMTRGLRHLALTENFLKEKYADGTCVLVKIASADNNSDIGTKRVTKPIFEKLTNEIIDKSLRVIKTKSKIDV